MAIEEQTARAVLSEVAGRELVAMVAPLLGRAAVPVMPLKGAWLQACAPRAVGARAITDVDLIVPEAQFARAIELLVDAGFSLQPWCSDRERTLQHPALRLPLDLHCRLFEPGAFRLATAALFARAQRDSAAFGVELMLPDPRDGFAHLVGHFVKSRTQADDRTRLDDFAIIVERFGLAAAPLAAHLHQAGMARAARYVFREPAYAHGDAFARALLQALPPDAGAERVVRAAGFLARAGVGGSYLGAMPGFLLEPSLVAGARALVLRARQRLRRRLQLRM